MTLGKVVDYFLKEYNKALKNSYVRKPISYALYHTWKMIDEKEKPRNDIERSN